MAEFGSKEWLAEMRAGGVKSATYFPDGRLSSVEFFPRGLLDVSDLVPADGDPREAATEPPPAQQEDNPPNLPPRIPPAIAAILKRGSVS